jgi:hypothetical protein
MFPLQPGFKEKTMKSLDTVHISLESNYISPICRSVSPTLLFERL